MSESLEVIVRVAGETGLGYLRTAYPPPLATISIIPEESLELTDEESAPYHAPKVSTLPLLFNIAKLEVTVAPSITFALVIDGG